MYIAFGYFSSRITNKWIDFNLKNSGIYITHDEYAVWWVQWTALNTAFLTIQHDNKHFSEASDKNVPNHFKMTVALFF